MAATQAQIAAQMIAQLRMLDPSVSAEVGTPERKILDTVAQALADAQIDLDGLSAGLDIDSKYGAALDRFLAIFGFARQKAAYATGFVSLGRISPANQDIRIPANTRVRANGDSVVEFATLYDAILPAGATSVIVPIRALTPGKMGNVAAYEITEIVSSSLYGITEVFNETATSNGLDVEDDDQFKVRFKNTVFRNMAGTQDQYLALAIATAYSTKASVVGPQSKYREYIQVPSVDDTQPAQVNGQGPLEPGAPTGKGVVGSYTTALSTIPYAKEIWTNISPFISSGTGPGAHFFRENVDFTFNLGAEAKNRGDAYRLYTAYPTVELNPTSAAASTKPNVSFTNVYTGSLEEVQAIRPNDILLLEYTYLSKASRNSLENNVTNAVDVYVDGGNETLASTVVSRPSMTSVFVDNATSMYHVENYRRTGYPETRPNIGNVLIPLYWQPVLSVPDVIVVGQTTYYKDVHYWAVEDVTELGGTVRARSGIEFSTVEYGQAQGDGDQIDQFAGPRIQEISTELSIPINGYTYDKNIVVLQAALEGSKQVTTDVLAHRSKTRYLKLDFSVMYTSGIPEADINGNIQSSVQPYLTGLYFGSVVQLSDVIQQAHAASGVDNIRWTTDLPGGPDTARAYQTDVDGKPLAGPTIQYYVRGRDYITSDDDNGVALPARSCVQHLFINGEPDSGIFVLRQPETGKTITINLRNSDGTSKTDDQIVSDINSEFPATTPVNPHRVTASKFPLSNDNARVKRRGFALSYSALGHRELFEILSSDVQGGPYVFDNDFVINDDETISLPANAYTPLQGTADSVPGVIARPRAQNTWIKS